jgi:hypothetical protein
VVCGCVHCVSLPHTHTTDVCLQQCWQTGPGCYQIYESQGPHLKSEPGAGTAATSMHIGTDITVLHRKCASHCVAAQPTCAADTSPNHMRSVLPGSSFQSCSWHHTAQTQRPTQLPHTAWQPPAKSIPPGAQSQTHRVAPCC